MRFGTVYELPPMSVQLSSGATGPVYGPEYRPELLNPSSTEYGPEYRPVELFLSEYKWWLIGGSVGLFLLAGGSILGLKLRKKRRSRR